MVTGLVLLLAASVDAISRRARRTGRRDGSSRVPAMSKSPAIGQEELRRANLSAPAHAGAHARDPPRRAALTRELGTEPQHHRRPDRRAASRSGWSEQTCGAVRGGPGGPSHVVVPRERLRGHRGDARTSTGSPWRWSASAARCWTVVRDGHHARRARRRRTSWSRSSRWSRRTLAAPRRPALPRASASPCPARSGPTTVWCASRPTSAGSTSRSPSCWPSAGDAARSSTGNDANLGRARRARPRRRGRAAPRSPTSAAASASAAASSSAAQPLAGASGYAGEVGHMLVDSHGPACRCGAIGCWETKIGENQLLTRAGRLPGGGPAAVAEVIAAAGAGEERAAAYSRASRTGSASGCAAIDQHLQPPGRRARWLPGPGLDVEQPR